MIGQLPSQPSKRVRGGLKCIVIMGRLQGNKVNNGDVVNTLNSDRANNSIAYMF